MSITALLDVRVTQEGLATAPAAIHETLAATRAFPGCLGVDVVVDVDDPTHFLAIERWESIEADAAYREWRKTPEGAASSLGSILAAAPTLTRFEDTPLI